MTAVPRSPPSLTPVTSEQSRLYIAPRTHLILLSTLNQAQISPLGGCVDITIPIGQAAYNSTVSLRSEQHPVTISLLAPAGCE